MDGYITFNITIDGQEMVVRYNPLYSTIAGYAHFEFLSPHNPRRRIPVSATGYLSHFLPLYRVEAAPSVEAYARAIALAFSTAKKSNMDDEENGSQLDLF